MRSVPFFMDVGFKRGENMYYSSFGALAIILHLIINYDIIFKNAYEGILRANKEYRRFLLGVTVYYVADILWGLLWDLRVVPLCYADTVLYFFSMVLSVFLWTKYTIAYLNDNSIFDAFLKWAGILIFGYQVINLIINFFRPVVFYFDENGTYFPLSSRYMTLGCQVMLYFVTSVHCFVVCRRKNETMRVHYFTIGVSGVVSTVFIVLQTLYPLLPFYAIGCILSTCLIHQFVLEEDKKELRRKLMASLDRETERRKEAESARKIAYTDALTGVKSKHAFVEVEEELNVRIRNGEVKEFGVVALDLNDLKLMNDTYGHEAGDAYIKEACRLICKTFQHSPVFRVGGDEFTVILEGDDYKNREALLQEFDSTIEANVHSKGVVIASGLATFRKDTDSDYQHIFERADKRMYQRKAELKAM